MLLIFTGCNVKDEDNVNAKSNSNEEEIILENNKGISSDIINKEDKDIENENTKTEAKEEIQQEEKITEDKADIKDINEFSDKDNTLNSWWFRRAVDHVPQRVNEDIDNLLKKYDGIYLESTDQQDIYLTFDEGYENGYTPLILDVLKENDVKAAFFITGYYLEKNSDLVKRMIDEGHIVGNHTINHPKMPEITDYNKLEEEILGLERDYYEMFNEKMTFLRPPSGAYSERTLAITKSLGYKTVFWSFAYADWDTNNQRGKDFAYETVMKELHNGEIMLLHAVSKDNAEALDDIIKNAKLLGYNFKSLDNFIIK
jgi:peptidoglycan-N-acetylmuramic acid deacetylase